MDEPRHIEYVPLDDLLQRRHPENPKAHDLPGLVESFRRFGFVDPIIEDGRTKLVMAGHGRLEGLDRMRGEHPGALPPAGLMVDHGAWKVPLTVGWASRDDDEARALLVALNQHTTAGGWHDRDLVTLLTNLADKPMGLMGTGFDEAQTAALAYLTRAPDVLVRNDPFDEWRGMPGFGEEPGEPVLTLKFTDAAERDRFIREVLGEGYPITRKKSAEIWHTYWPARPMNDLMAVKFVEAEA